MGRARRFSIKSRALGLGTMGLAALYQNLGIPFASPEARKLNIEIHREIQQLAIRASKRLADLYGEPEWCKGTSMRNTHLTAIAPTRTNSVICNAISQGVEPIDSNYYVAKQSKGAFVRKNTILENTLNDLNQNTYAVWKSILDNRGSVQHLDFLSDEIKNVFKTAREIDQFEIIKQAEDRQKYICQGQSINLFVDPHCSPEYLYKLHLLAWKVGLKSLYYLRNNSAQLVSKEKIDNFTDGWIIITSPTCPWCAKAKAFLTEKEFNFKELSVSEAKKHNLWKNTWTTVPKIIYDNYIRIESYEDLVEFFAETESDLTINTINQCSINECSACEA